MNILYTIGWIILILVGLVGFIILLYTTGRIMTKGVLDAIDWHMREKINTYKSKKEENGEKVQKD